MILLSLVLEGTSVEGLVEDGKIWAFYLSVKDTVATSSVLEINLPEGSYNLTWLDTKSAGKTNEQLKDHPGGWARISSPDYSEDIALKILLP